MLLFYVKLLDHSVQKIVDQGFSVEQAEYALKVSRNNVERALKSLQRTSDNRSGGGREPRETREARPKRFEKKSEETKPSSGKVSLFDFLEDKLPAQTEAAETHGSQSLPQRSNDNSGNYRVEQHFERLELRGSEYSQAGRGGRYTIEYFYYRVIYYYEFYRTNICNVFVSELKKVDADIRRHRGISPRNRSIRSVRVTTVTIRLAPLTPLVTLIRASRRGSRETRSPTVAISRTTSSRPTTQNRTSQTNAKAVRISVRRATTLPCRT